MPDWARRTRRAWVWLAALLAIGVVEVPPAHGQNTTPGEGVARVRAANPKAAEVVTEARRRSPTVRALLAKIEDTDLIVYVDTRLQTNPAETAFVGRSSAVRILRISMDVTQTVTGLTPWLGHELYHAVEIASDPTIVSTSRLEASYLSRGYAVAGGGYCTNDAQEITGVVRAEIVALLPARSLVADASARPIALPERLQLASPARSVVSGQRVGSTRHLSYEFSRSREARHGVRHRAAGPEQRNNNSASQETRGGDYLEVPSCPLHDIGDTLPDSSRQGTQPRRVPI